MEGEDSADDCQDKLSDDNGGAIDSSYEIANTSSSTPATNDDSTPLKPCNLFDNIEFAKKPAKKPKLDLVDIEFAKYLQRKNQEEESRSSNLTENDDPDRAFLHSLLPYMKSMTEDEKLYFQIETMKFIRSIKKNVSQMHSETQQHMTPQVQQPQAQQYYGQFDPQYYS